MQVNVGGVDRVLRMVAGAALIVLAATDTIGVWGYVGVVVAATGIFQFCPAYLPFGLSSKKSCSR